MPPRGSPSAPRRKRSGRPRGISRGSACDRGWLELDQGRDVVALQPVTAAEGLELDEERERDDLALELLHELDGPGDRASGREKVVDDEDLRARLHRVLVHLERRRAVLEVVLDAHDVRGELPELADRNEADAEGVRDRPPQHKAPPLHPPTATDPLPPPPHAQPPL